MVLLLYQVYTDGCTVTSGKHSDIMRSLDGSSIFTAEAKAVDIALDFISTCDTILFISETFKKLHIQIKKKKHVTSF